MCVKALMHYLYLTLLLACAVLSPLRSVLAERAEVHKGCFGRIAAPDCSNDGKASSSPSRQTFLAPFRKPNQPYSIGKKVVGNSDARASFGGTAAIVSQTFKKVTTSHGEWSGVVAGNGVVHLALQILENGAVTSTRYIGNVTLLNHSTTFHFRSSIPLSQGWNWKIVAFNRPA